MVAIGQYNHLVVARQVDFGVYLDGEELGEILLPRRYVPENCKPGQKIKVFIYADSEDELIATTEKPYATVGQCAYLKVKASNDVGVFMDWGLLKDLLVPFNEQAFPMNAGRSYVVYVYLDESTDRIAASTKLHHHLSEDGNEFELGQEVSLMIASRSSMGYKAAINNTHLGLIHKTEVFQPLKFGQNLKGYIKTIRPDGKIDLSLRRSARDDRDKLEDQIVAYLKKLGGSCTITDKSPPDLIYKVFKSSKANYKRALGRLYKKKVILIDKERISLL